MFHARALLTTLVAHQVEFVVIGGMAMVSHGSSHVTRDLDICYDRSDENIDRLARALSPLQPSLRDAPPALPFVWDAKTIEAGFNFTLDTSAGPLDLIAEVPGVGLFEDVRKQANLLEVYKSDIRVLNLEALIESKRAAARPKDAAHLLELEELRRLRDEEQSDG